MLKRAPSRASAVHSCAVVCWSAAGRQVAVAWSAATRPLVVPVAVSLVEAAARELAVV